MTFLVICAINIAVNQRQKQQNITVQYLLSHHPHILSSLLSSLTKRSARIPKSPLTSLGWFSYGKLIYFRLLLGSVRKRTWILIGSSTLALSIITPALLFIRPQTITLSVHTSKHCFDSFTPLPETLAQSTSHVRVEHKSSLTLSNTSLLATQSCVELAAIPTQALEESVTISSVLGLKKQITLEVSNPPSVDPQFTLEVPHSGADPLTFQLSEKDNTYTYQLMIVDKYSDCEVSELTVSCPVESLALTQGSTYEYSLIRRLSEQTTPAVQGSFKVRDPVLVTASSLQPEQLVYEQLQSITITANKALKDAGLTTITQDGAAEPLPAASTISDTSLTITAATPLPRGAGFTLRISGLTAQDGAYLAQDYTLHFSTSTGPKVTAVSIGTYKVATSAAPVITFDVALNEAQEIGKYVTLKQAGQVIGAAVRVRGNQVTIQASSPLSACSDYSLEILDGIQSTYGVSGGSGWTYTFRTICQSTFSIGSSVQGRSITAYRFGSGSTKIVYIGGMHGNEKSSVLTLQSWVDELERTATSIPASKTVIVIPNLNPDGYVTSRRTNANNIDLNRNFPSNDWTSNAYQPGNVLLEGGGGQSPLSEPESQALASYVQSADPALVLTYHASGSVVIGNELAGVDNYLATYAAKSGFSSSSSSHEDGVFSYPTTGEFETWTRDKAGIPTLLIELRTLSGNEIRTQSSAMWAMLD